MSGRFERWRRLRNLEEWLRTPMLLLSLGWLVIIVVDLTVGTNQLLSVFTMVIWIIFIAEFVLRFTLAPGKRTFLND